MRRGWALVTLAILGGAGGACRRAAPQTPTPAQAQRSAPVAAVVVPRAVAVLPDGWRDLKFGMSEAEVQHLIAGYETKPGIAWEKSARPRLLTVRLDAGAVDLTGVDPDRYHQWSIADLDDGAGRVTAWHEDGKLVALEVTGKVSADVFLLKATEAYGAPPEPLRLSFGEEATGASEMRAVSLWRDKDTLALVWPVFARTPVLLVWSA